MNENQLTQSKDKQELARFEFTKTVFKELTEYDADEQSLILTELYRMLVEKYECEQEELSVKIESVRKKLATIKSINPNEPILPIERKY